MPCRPLFPGTSKIAALAACLWCHPVGLCGAGARDGGRSGVDLSRRSAPCGGLGVAPGIPAARKYLGGIAVAHRLVHGVAAQRPHQAPGGGVRVVRLPSSRSKPGVCPADGAKVFAWSLGEDGAVVAALGVSVWGGRVEVAAIRPGCMRRWGFAPAGGTSSTILGRFGRARGDGAAQSFAAIAIARGSLGLSWCLGAAGSRRCVTAARRASDGARVNYSA